MLNNKKQNTYFVKYSKAAVSTRKSGVDVDHNKKKNQTFRDGEIYESKSCLSRAATRETSSDQTDLVAERAFFYVCVCDTEESYSKE